MHLKPGLTSVFFAEQVEIQFFLPVCFIFKGPFCYLSWISLFFFIYWKWLYQINVLVLVLAETELIFLVAWMVLSFGLVVKRALITMFCIGYTPQGLFCLSPLPDSRWVGSAWGVGRAPQKSWSAINAGKRRRKGAVWNFSICLPHHCYTWWSPAFLEMVNTCLLMEAVGGGLCFPY